MFFNTAWGLILTFALVCLVENILMYAVGWYGYGKRAMYAHNKYLPPGYMIGIVWIGIFAALGYAFFLSYSGDPTVDYLENPKGWNKGCIVIIVVASWCLLYPFMTMFIPAEYIRILNYVSLLMAFVVSLFVFQECVAAFWYTLPLLLWTAYVCFADLMACKDCQGCSMHHLMELDIKVMKKSPLKKM